jgi:hypothetical protein
VADGDPAVDPPGHPGTRADQRRPASPAAPYFASWTVQPGAALTVKIGQRVISGGRARGPCGDGRSHLIGRSVADSGLYEVLEHIVIDSDQLHKAALPISHSANLASQ